MRDKLKDKEYFCKYLDYQNLRIEKKMSKLKEAEGEKRQRILLSLTGYLVDKLKAEFSFGTSKDNLIGILGQAIEITEENANVTYDDLLTILAFSVMLGETDNTEKLIKTKKDAIEKDRLLYFLGSFILTGTEKWDMSIPLVSEYDNLNIVFEDDDKEIALKKYLNNWYSAHRGYAWFDSHLRDTDTYCGYWSFESAAIVRILGISENSVIDMDYYPSL